MTIGIKFGRICKFLIVTCLSSCFVQHVLANDSDSLNSQVVHYIEDSWDLLTRSHKNWLQSGIDPKLPIQKLIIYLPEKENIELIKSEIASNKSALIEFKHLPKNYAQIKEHGLLYLPHPYVVPGGRFNEMYGWDSFFIELGLLETNRLTLAKNMVDNVLYEIMNYGMILNANRTYYLGRTQPPFLTQMILAYYEKKPDNAWLQSTLPAINKLYNHWTSPPHSIPDLGLSRYYAGGQGITPEESPTYYEKVVRYFKTHSITDYDKSLFFDEHKNQLTDLFYIADRTVRESGFDITAKYGPFGAGILDYAPVDLNVLLYKMEQDTQKILNILGQFKAANEWGQRAKHRAITINRYLWDQRAGYYYDYNFKTKERKIYPFATTFYPLWAGIASREQAAAVMSHVSDLLVKGGVVTSINHSGLQWDAPFGWAPMQYFAVLGLQKYGYSRLAVEIAQLFINTVNTGYERHHAIFEKYDVKTLSTRTDNKIKYSYTSNEIGFGWTNGVYMAFLKLLNQS